MFLTRCVLMIMFVVGLTSIAQDEAALAAMQEHMTPGEAHQLLATHTGNWNAEITTWSAPKAKPIVVKGTAVMDMVLGGRFLKTTLTSTVMDMPFTGLSYEGFDNTRKIFTMVWMDSFGTSMTYGEGSYNAEEKAVYILGAMLDPATGQDLKYQSITRLVDADTLAFSMISEIGGEEFTSIKIIYTRIQ